MKYISLFLFLLFSQLDTTAQNIIWEKFYKYDSLRNSNFMQIVKHNDNYYFSLKGIDMSEIKHYTGLVKINGSFETERIIKIAKDKPVFLSKIYLGNDNITLATELTTVWGLDWYAIGYFNLIKLDFDCNIIYDYLDSITAQTKQAFTGEMIKIDDSYLGIYHKREEGKNKLFIKKYDQAGNFVSEGTYDFLPDSITYIGGSVMFDDYIVTNEGNFLFAGSTSSTTYGNKPFMIKYDKDLNYLWHQYYPIEGIIKINYLAMIQVSDSSFYFSAKNTDFGANPDSIIYLFHLDKDGSILDKRCLNYASIRGIYETSDGKLILAASQQDDESGTTANVLALISKDLQLPIEKEFIFYNDSTQKTIFDMHEENGKLLVCGSYDYYPFAACIEGFLGTSDVEDIESSINATFYPNPVENELMISGIPSGSSVQIFNILSESVFKTNELMEYNNSLKIDLSSFQCGVYYVKIRHGNMFITRKIIKY
jgi:hypothetical protein